MVQSWEEFLKLDKEQRTATLPKLVEQAGSRKDLATKFNISVHAINGHFRDLALAKISLNKKKGHHKEQGVKEHLEQHETQVPMILDDPSLFKHAISGEMSGEEFNNFTAVISTLLGKNKKYSVVIQIKEVR